MNSRPQELTRADLADWPPEIVDLQDQIQGLEGQLKVESDPDQMARLRGRLLSTTAALDMAKRAAKSELGEPQH
jgi:hypothetical protein